MKNETVTSRQTIGLNKFSMPHSVLTSLNFGEIVPICWEEVDIGDTVHNNIDGFFRSSALTEPSFIDADISVAHYFVPFELMDPLYTLRAQQFKGGLTDVNTPRVIIAPQDVSVDPTDFEKKRQMLPAFNPKSLSARLGINIREASSLPDGMSGGTINLYPYLAYHIICDEFFSNTRLQDAQRTRKFIMDKVVQAGMDGTLSYTVITEGQPKTVKPHFDTALNPKTQVYHNLLALRYVNFESDYFTSATREPGGPDISIPANGTIRQLLDAELMQKVSDLLYNGGYSYNDFQRVIHGVSDLNHEAHDPIFLGGSTGPFQMNTVTATGDNLGDQAGTLTGGTGFTNEFTHTFTAPGIYMAVAYARPSTYYDIGIPEKFSRVSLGSRLNPLLSDLSKAPIMISELSGDYTDYLKDYGSSPDEKTIFGYKDRYEEYRWARNTVNGEFLTTRQNWYIARGYDFSFEIEPDFIQMTPGTISYKPWNITDASIDHFFCRFYNDLWITRKLPRQPYPYVW